MSLSKVTNSTGNRSRTKMSSFRAKSAQKKVKNHMRDLLVAVKELGQIRSSMPQRDLEDPKIAAMLQKRFLGAYTGGSNEPAILKARLPFTPVAVSTGAGGTLNGVSGLIYGTQFTSLVDYATWRNVFAEFRFTHIEMIFVPSGCNVLTGADNGFAAAIDWDGSITSPGSLAAVLTLDDPKVVAMGLTKPTKWQCNLEKLFGEVWSDTATNTTNFLSWKAYSMGTGSASVNYGYWYAFADVEFRGFH